MRITHVVKRAIKAPQPGKSYGARVGGYKLRATGITVEWEIFGHKNRKKRGKKSAA